MNNRVGGLTAIVGAAVLCLAVPAYGQQSAVVNFTNNPDGIYDPYQGTVTIGGSTVPNDDSLVCDDALHNVDAPESWNATAYLVSSLTSTTVQGTFFGNAIGLTGYTEAAAIANALLTGQTTLAGLTGLSNVDLSQALWIITTPGGNPSGVGALTSNALQLVANLEAEAGGDDSTGTLAALSSFTDLYVLTPGTDNTGDGYQISGETYGDGVPQEMFTLVPEGGAAFLYLLLAGAACFGTMRFASRSQLGRHEAA